MSMQISQQQKYIELAIEKCDGALGLADALGLKSPSQIGHWRSGIRPLPAKHCVPIELATNGEVTRYQLRPDIFGEPPVEKIA